MQRDFGQFPISAHSMSRSSIFAPVRALLAPRPAIQAWRVGRCYATTITSERASAPNLPPVSATFQSAQDGPFVSGSVGQSAQSSDLAPQDIRIESARAAPEQTNVAAEPLGTKAIPVGVVVSAGKMQKTVKVRIPGMKFHKHLRKVCVAELDDLRITVKEGRCTDVHCLAFQNPQQSSRTRPELLYPDRRRY